MNRKYEEIQAKLGGNIIKNRGLDKNTAYQTILRKIQFKCRNNTKKSKAGRTLKINECGKFKCRCVSKKYVPE